VAGIATFVDLELDSVATGYSLVATSGGLASDTSGAFNVVPVPARRLVFTVQPGTVSAGVAIAPAVAVTVQDTLGATLTGFTGPVRIGIGTNPVGGTLSGTTTVAAVAGVAMFSDLTIDKAGSGYALVATSDSALPAMSATFDVTGGGMGPLPRFGHEVIVLEENHNFDQADSVAMPYLHSLIAQGGLATQYYANTHPSIGNYFWLTTGQLITNNDSYSLTVSSDNIVRQLLAAGKTWKSYAEDLPSVGFTGQTSGKYARKHNPLSFFSDVVNDSAQIKRLVPFTQFATDLAGDTLPNYAFVVPNLNDDAHDGTLQTADADVSASEHDAIDGRGIGAHELPWRGGHRVQHGRILRALRERLFGGLARDSLQALARHILGACRPSSITPASSNQPGTSPNGSKSSPDE
jgi:hypothetical protein